LAALFWLHGFPTCFGFSLDVCVIGIDQSDDFGSGFKTLNGKLL